MGGCTDESCTMNFPAVPASEPAPVTAARVSKASRAGNCSPRMSPAEIQGFYAGGRLYGPGPLFTVLNGHLDRHHNRRSTPCFATSLICTAKIVNSDAGAPWVVARLRDVEPSGIPDRPVVHRDLRPALRGRDDPRHQRRGNLHGCIHLLFGPLHLAYTGILRVNGSYVMDASSHYVANVQNARVRLWVRWQ